VRDAKAAQTIPQAKALSNSLQGKHKRIRNI